jgi:hypothetical protein
VNYAEETVKIMVPLLKFYFHDDVRTAAAESIPCLLECAKVRGNAYVAEMWAFIYQEFIKAIESEPEREVLCEMMTSLSAVIESLGKEFLNNEHLDLIIQVMDELLKDHFTRSQQRLEKRKDEDYDEGVEESLVDEDDEDVYVLSKVADVLHSCFEVFKDEFVMYFDRIAHHFVSLAGADRSWNEHQWAICVFDDVIEHGGDNRVKYKDFFLPLLVNGVQSNHPEIRQAAAYGWGILGKCGGEAFAQTCNDCIPLLGAMIEAPESRKEENINATENAVAAVTKILQFNSSRVNVNELLPVWFRWLPVWEDEEELPLVYDFLLTLVECQNPLIMGENNANLPQIVAVVAEVLARNAIDPKSPVGLKIASFLKLLQQNTVLFTSCFEVLNPQLQEAVKQAIIAT